MATITTFERYALDNQQWSPASREHNRVVLGCLVKHAGKDLMDVSEGDAKAYLATLTSPGTWNQRVIMLRKFGGWRGMKWFKQPDGKNWKKKKTENTRAQLAQAITPDHVTRMVSACHNLRDMAMVAFVFDGGARLGEVVSATIGGTSFDEYGVVVQVTGKTGPRPVRCVQAAALLSQWVENHPRKGDPKASLFCNLESHHGHAPRGEPMQRAGIKHVFRDIEERCKQSDPGFPHIFPHIGRHVSASRKTKAKVSPQVLMGHYGWKTMSMINVYSHLTGADVDEGILEAAGIHKSVIPPQANKCPKCGMGNVIGMRYCARCAYPLTTEGVNSLEEKKAGFAKDALDPDILKLLADPDLKSKLQALAALKTLVK